MEDVEFKSFYNENVIAKPFQIIKESEEHKAPTNKEIKSIQVQNNYSNRMLSSIATQIFKLEEIINPPSPEEIPSLFQPLEKVKVKTQKQKLLDEINKRLESLKGKSSINVINEEDAAQFMEDFENLFVNEEEKQINKINFG
uniref:Uncharacterized protein n=1 Tax=Cucumis melo TaxID=3656 RepID=A0A9I9EKR6_CUCME